MSRKQIIFLELNEVPQLILNRYSNFSSSFRYLINQFNTYKTTSHDEIHLSPWITWSTIHRGVTYNKHLIQNLGQDLSSVNKKYPPIWESLCNAGYKVGVFGSLHSSTLPTNIDRYSFYVPDPFSDHSKCKPELIQPIQEFQLALSRKSARNVEKSFVKSLNPKFLIALAKNGVRGATVLQAINQLAQEKIVPTRICRRRVYQTILNFDIYMSLLQKESTHFSTFFSNHVASAMHRYWEAAFPEDYDASTQSQDWKQLYKDEIYYAMKITHHIIERLLQFAKMNPECEIWICSSMGQAPVQGYESISSQLFMTDAEKFLKALGVDPSKYNQKPTMMPRITLEADSIEDIAKLSYRLESLYIDGVRCEQMPSDKTLSLRFMKWNNEPLIKLDGTCMSLFDMGMSMVHIEDNSGTSAYHVADGILLTYGKNSDRFNSDVSIRTDEIKGMIEAALLS